MSTLFGTLGVAKSGLYAAQLALQTTSNNVANAATPGYSRQRVDLKEAPPETLPVGQLGTGVSVDGIRRLRDQFLDHQFYQAQRTLGERQATQETLSQIEAHLGEPSDEGLQASLSKFFASLHDLASYPGDLTTRRAVLEQGQILAGDFNRLSTGLIDLTRNLESDLATKVGNANTILQEIADLNGQIQAVTVAGGSPNALLDQRDTRLDELSRLVGIATVAEEDGNVRVSLLGGGGLLVDGQTAGTLGAQLSATSDVYALTLGGNVVTPTGGEISGLLDSRNDPDNYVKYAQGQLDSLASALIQQMNRLQADGAGTAGLGSTTSQYVVSDPANPLGAANGLPFDPATGSFRVFVYDANGAVTGSGTVNVTAGTTTLNSLAADPGWAAAGLTASVASGRLTVSAPAGSTFRFVNDTTGALGALGANSFFTGTDARSMAVNSALVSDPQLLSTATPDPATGRVGPGDNSIALAMADLSAAKILEGGTATPVDFYAATIGVLGARMQAANRLVDSQTLVAQTIDNQRQQVSGVSLNEEMADLIRYQYAFQASARMITVVDDMLDTVVNGMLR
ncbi:MAG TPA: flagellar hook-associated protein FlgK [Candidatus Methylomirabilis sp.]|nr:flagellar hook-associated protein FlgK [Candidatus Methylomirabilis sp.]